MPYVYPPVLATIMSVIQRRYGLAFELVLYGALYGFCIFGTFYALFSGTSDERRFRIPFLCALTAKAMLSGNVSLVLHPIIFFISTLSELRFLAVLVVIVATVIKPTFAVYIVLFLFMRQPLSYRIFISILSTAGIAAYFVWFLIYDPNLFTQWIVVATKMGLAMTGHSFEGIPGVAEMANNLVRGALYISFSAIVIIAGLFISECFAECERDSILVGIAVCVLISPRLMVYDQWTLPFGMAVIARYWSTLCGAYDKWFYALLLLIWVIVATAGGAIGGAILWSTCVFLIVALGMAAKTWQWRGREMRLQQLAVGFRWRGVDL